MMLKMKSNKKNLNKKGNTSYRKLLVYLRRLKNSNLAQKFHRQSSQLEINPKSIKIFEKIIISKKREKNHQIKKDQLKITKKIIKQHKKIKKKLAATQQ